MIQTFPLRFMHNMIKNLYKGFRAYFTFYRALYTKGLGGHSGSPPPVQGFLLQETGFEILQEGGGGILLNI